MHIGKKLALVLTGVALLITGAVAVYAEAQDFTVTNKTGFVISSLFVSPIKDRNWGEDILGRDELPSGREVDIHFTGYGQKCRFDIMLKDDDDNEYVVEDINLCEIHRLTFTRKGKSVLWQAN
jgi:hypothetical protein